MNLVGYTATALSSNDITDTPKDKNVVSGAIVELKTFGGDLVTIYDDAAGTNPETQKTCDSDGQCEFYAEEGGYNLEVNGKVNKISLFFNKDKVNDLAAWGDRFVGYFSDGFTYTKADDVAKGIDGKYYSYSGVSAYPVVVAADTVPSEPDYTTVVFNDVEDIEIYLDKIKNFEVMDFNFDQPFRLESDYDVSVDVFGIVHTGQSLAEGGTDGAVVGGVNTPSYPDRVLMFSPRPVGLSSSNLSAFTDNLVEATRVTIGHSLTSNLAKDNENIFLFSGQAWGGQAYSALKKGGSTGVYEACIQQVQNAKNQFPSIKYLAVTNIHGEQDGLNNNTNYAADLNEWQQDFNTDIKAVTGQTENVVMYIDQTSSGSGYGFNGGITENTFPTPLEQLKAHEDYSDIVLVCPKYFIQYTDHSHITNMAQRILGEYHAKAQKVGNTYNPLKPSSATAVGNTITITFEGVAGSLSFDTTKVQPTTNQGFSYVDDSGRSITSVALQGTNQVVITLDGSVGANPQVAYAYHNGSGGAANQIAGLGDRGNLRDNESTTSLYDPSYVLHNWCVTFKMGVTV